MLTLRKPSPVSFEEMRPAASSGRAPDTTNGAEDRRSN